MCGSCYIWRGAGWWRGRLSWHQFLFWTWFLNTYRREMRVRGVGTEWGPGEARSMVSEYVDMWNDGDAGSTWASSEFLPIVQMLRFHRGAVKSVKCALMLRASDSSANSQRSDHQVLLPLCTPHTPYTHSHMHAYTCTHSHAHSTHTHLHAYHTHAHTTHTHTHAHTHAHTTHTCAHSHTCTHHTHMHTLTCTHSHAHTNTCTSPHEVSCEAGFAGRPRFTPAPSLSTSHHLSEEWLIHLQNKVHNAFLTGMTVDIKWNLYSYFIVHQPRDQGKRWQPPAGFELWVYNFPAVWPWADY